MKLKHFSAVKTLNGNLLWRVRKWRFSLTRISAPTYSVYAAMKASAGLKPSVSYLAPNSKGTINSSSILVNLFARSINSLNASGVRLLRTSSMINLVMRMVIFSERLAISSMSFSQLSLRIEPRANIYWLLSRMSNKPFLPKFFPGFPDFVNYLLFVHPGIGRFDFRHKPADFSDMLKHLFDFFHCISPLNKVYYIASFLSIRNQSRDCCLKY